MDIGNGIAVTTLPDNVRCACGELLVAGERVGVDSGTGRALCLWCLADVQAGRARPRRRRSSGHPMPAVSVPPIPQAVMRRPRRSPRSPSALVSLVVALSLVVGALWLRDQVVGESTDRSIAGIPVAPLGDLAARPLGSPVTGAGARASWPPVPADASNHPLGAPSAPQSRSFAYAFMDTLSGPGSEPVRWDPCRPVHVVVNSASAPPGAAKLLSTGLGEVSRVTGLRFVLDGPTDEPPASQRPPTDPERYGDRWSPVLVAWSDPTRVPQLAGAVAGLAGPAGAPYSSERDKHWVSGTVYLDGPSFTQILNRPGDGWWQGQAIVLHELAHLAGLTHIDDTTQLMAPRNSRQLTFADGDLEGLRRLGGGPCFT